MSNADDAMPALHKRRRGDHTKALKSERLAVRIDAPLLEKVDLLRHTYPRAEVVRDLLKAWTEGKVKIWWQEAPPVVLPATR